MTENYSNLLQYWIETSFCECDADHAIGGCFHCDMEKVKQQYDEMRDKLMTHRPNRWCIIRMANIHRIFGSWSGGYLDGDSWRCNSGIKKVEDHGTVWHVWGENSESMYILSKSSYGTTAYGAGVLAFMGAQEDIGITVLSEEEAIDLLNSHL